MLVYAFALRYGIVVGGVDSHYRDEIVEGTHQRPGFPVAAQYWKYSDVNNEIGTLIGELSGCFGLSPEIDAYRQAKLAKIGGKNPKRSITLRHTQLMPLHGAHITFALPSHQPTRAIKQGSRVVEPFTLPLHQPCNDIDITMRGGGGQLFFPLIRKIFREAYYIQLLAAQLIDEQKRVTQIPGIVKRRIRFWLYYANANIVFHYFCLHVTSTQ
jgi:hypothetical protein